MEMGLVEGEVPARAIAFLSNFWRTWCWKSKYQQLSPKCKAHNDSIKDHTKSPKGYQCYFFLLHNFPGTLTEKSLMSVSEVATG